MSDPPETIGQAAVAASSCSTSLGLLRAGCAMDDCIRRGLDKGVALIDALQAGLELRTSSTFSARRILYGRLFDALERTSVGKDVLPKLDAMRALLVTVRDEQDPEAIAWVARVRDPACPAEIAGGRGPASLVELRNYFFGLTTAFMSINARPMGCF